MIDSNKMVKVVFANDFYEINKIDYYFINNYFY